MQTDHFSSDAHASPVGLRFWQGNQRVFEAHMADVALPCFEGLQTDHGRPGAHRSPVGLHSLETCPAIHRPLDAHVDHDGRARIKVCRLTSDHMEPTAQFVGLRFGGATRVPVQPILELLLHHGFAGLQTDQAQVRPTTILSVCKICPAIHPLLDAHPALDGRASSLTS